MNKNYYCFLSLLFTNALFAQEVISTQGETYSNASTNIDFTIGEVIIQTETNTTTHLTQGFHQTNWKFVGLTEHIPNFDFQLFPNPTSEVLNLQVSDFNEVEYALIDFNGKLVLQGKLLEANTLLNVKNLAAGNYELTLSRNAQPIKIIKLSKTN